MLAKSVRVVFLILSLVHLLLRNLPSPLSFTFPSKRGFKEVEKKTNTLVDANFSSLSSTTPGDVQHQLSVRAEGMYVRELGEEDTTE